MELAGGSSLDAPAGAGSRCGQESKIVELWEARTVELARRCRAVLPGYAEGKSGKKKPAGPAWEITGPVQRINKKEMGRFTNQLAG